MKKTKEEIEKKLEDFGFRVKLVSKGQAYIHDESENGFSLGIPEGDEYHIKSDVFTLFIVHLADRTVDVEQSVCLEDLEGLKRFNEIVKLCFELLDVEED